MTLKDTVRTNITAALKAGDKLRLSVNRMLLAAVEAVEKDGKGAVTSLSDTQVMQVFVSEARQRRGAAEDYIEKGAPTEHIERVLAEAAVIDEYLPAPPNDAELEALVGRAVEAVKATTMREMGAVMKVVKAAAPTADGKKVSDLVKAALAG
jgi:uncharacterized protein YqeY